MPELPDVERFRRYFNRTALHQRITDVLVHSPKILRRVTRRTLKGRLVGRCMISTQRHGKWLLGVLDDRGVLALHFGMTAFLRYGRTGQVDGGHVRLSIHFSKGAQLAFDDQRLFGRVMVADDPAAFIAQQRLGPDALSMTWQEFHERLAHKRGIIKSVLMDQTVLAGIGNLYADEILFQGRVHPLARTDRLGDRRLRSLHGIMCQVLREAIRRQSDPHRFPGSWLFRHRVKDAKCPRCGGPLMRIRSAQRSAYFCPRCQRR